MAKRLYIVLADSDSINEEELNEAGNVVSFAIEGDNLSKAEMVLKEAKASTICVDLHIYSASKKIVEINAGASLDDVM